MDDLIISVLSGAASPFEEERLRHWRDEDPGNERYFQDMASVWVLTEPEAVIPASPPPDVADILGRAPAPIRRTRPWMPWALLAASVSAVALGIQVMSGPEPERLAVYEAAGQEAQGVTLNDGSFVRLAPGAGLEEWGVDGHREVSLRGRAFFAVAKDPDRPFVVRTGSSSVEVLGTRFQVDSEGDRVAAVVVEGTVRMANDLGQVQVAAGSMGTMAGGRAPEAQVVADVYALLDWPQGTLAFQATPLRMVVREVSRFYGRELRVEPGVMEARRITASFLGNTFDEVTESLCLVAEANCVPEGSGVFMKAREDR